MTHKFYRLVGKWVYLFLRLCVFVEHGIPFRWELLELSCSLYCRDRDRERLIGRERMEMNDRG